MSVIVRLVKSAPYQLPLHPSSTVRTNIIVSSPFLPLARNQNIHLEIRTMAAVIETEEPINAVHIDGLVSTTSHNENPFHDFLLETNQ